MGESQEREMITITEAARETHVSPNTIRWWGKNGLLSDWEARPTITGKAWYTTIEAVQERKANRPKRGRPVR